MAEDRAEAQGPEGRGSGRQDTPLTVQFVQHIALQVAAPDVAAVVHVLQLVLQRRGRANAPPAGRSERRHRASRAQRRGQGAALQVAGQLAAKGDGHAPSRSRPRRRRRRRGQGSASASARRARRRAPTGCGCARGCAGGRASLQAGAGDGRQACLGGAHRREAGGGEPGRAHGLGGPRERGGREGSLGAEGAGQPGAALHRPALMRSPRALVSNLVTRQGGPAARLPR